MSSSNLTISLRDPLFGIGSDLTFLHRKIEREYRVLPWPSEIQNIVFLTYVAGGRGDIAAAAKVIGLMQRIYPSLNFDWILYDMRTDIGDPYSYLQDRTKVKVRYKEDKPPDGSANLIVQGPCLFYNDEHYLNQIVNRKIEGPLFAFAEIAANIVLKKESDIETSQNYNEIHLDLFPNNVGGRLNNYEWLRMGLERGSGILLDSSRINAPLSRKFSCPTYLAHIQDERLQNDILAAMGGNADYQRVSMNCGYAHYRLSWENFIDCVAGHEQKKDLIIVLNQRSEYNNLSTEQFFNHVFTTERLSFLNSKGYGKITLKGGEDQPFSSHQSEGRHLTVIIRPSFTPTDMKWLQLASERILATGDNTPTEAWCARCRLYFYENIGGDKDAFLAQQIDLAKSISPNLARILQLFAGQGNRRYLFKTEKAEMQQLLEDPDLDEATLKFCAQIIENYSFAEVIEGALKRAAWHYVLPELSQIEASTLDGEFREGIISYFRNKEVATLHVTTLGELGKKIDQAVKNHIQGRSDGIEQFNSSYFFL
jgi:hypothetical protein